MDLVVLGAGPKAAAIAAKAHVLNELGYGPLRVAIVERREVAAYWTGRHGFTTGQELLGTRPEKDVGFPYQSTDRLGTGGRQIDAAMLCYSWQSYLVHTGDYRRWVDSGAPQPTHNELARYLAWVLDQVSHGVRLHRAAVTEIALEPGGWRLLCRNANGKVENIVAERGLVLTGPGEPKSLPYAAEVAHRIISPAMTADEMQAINLLSSGRVCIIGSGESAASVALSLIRRYGEDLELTFVAPSLPYSRAESFLENAAYSDPDLVAWSRLSEGERHEFVRRTDRGVISPAALAQLARHRKLAFVVGRVRQIRLSPNGLARVEVDQPDEVVRQEFDAVAICIGSCPLVALLRMLNDSRAAVEARLDCSLADESSVVRRLDSSLALRGLTPRLHLPALAGLAHGPGFSNLSCLGKLSDAVLSAYLPNTQPVNSQPFAAPSLLYSTTSEGQP
jgi:mycobactin lysine-N-oxygenase